MSNQPNKWKIEFKKHASDQLQYWLLTNRKIYDKIFYLLNNMMDTPFHGLGKPEPLKHQRSGEWSRRIDQKNRLIYKVEGDIIIIISCKGHYGD